MYWGKDVLLEARCRDYKGARLSDERHHVEIFSMHPALRFEVFYPVPGWWVYEEKGTEIFSVPSTSLLAY